MKKLRIVVITCLTLSAILIAGLTVKQTIFASKKVRAQHYQVR
ncbi:hypothetical protein [Secundilactobacillus paracollinoides]